MLTWESKYGSITIDPDGLSVVEGIVVDWEEKNPPPNPPMVPITPDRLNHTQSYNAVNLAQARNIPIHVAEEIICRQIGDVPDPSNAEFLEKLEAWELERAVVFQNNLIDHCCAVTIDGTPRTYRDIKTSGLIRDALKLEDTVPLVQTLTDRDESARLYKQIVSGAVLTWEDVLEAARTIGIQRNGKPILEVSQTTGGGEAQPLNGLLHLAASQFNIVDVSTKSIKEQAHILALYLTKSWVTHYEYEDAKNK